MSKAPLATQAFFAEQECKALELGKRMAAAGFSPEDNPFTALNPRIAQRWSRGYWGVHALQNLVSAR